ncbi:response regulator [Mangrovimonas cancribranchiae]|uniref:Response regulator n=1 Tax=Mangrovimonas cancribranchiae TaxID=3080055 RepID=A0AAU6NXY6_9FLAO
MFKKVLVVDDLMSINLGVNAMLKNGYTQNVVYAHYCDDAILKLKRAEQEGDPFDLLITDLSFKQDHREQKLKNGEDLVMTVNMTWPDLNVIVYSVEDKIQRIRRLIHQYQAKAYVCKGRYGLKELEQAVEAINQNKTYLSSAIEMAVNGQEVNEIDDFDILLLNELALGLSQDQISKQLKKKNVTPSSLSSIEKRLNKLKIQLQANNSIHLVAIAKDMGII